MRIKIGGASNAGCGPKIKDVWGIFFYGLLPGASVLHHKSQLMRVGGPAEEEKLLEIVEWQVFTKLMCEPVPFQKLIPNPCVNLSPFLR